MLPKLILNNKLTWIFKKFLGKGIIGMNFSYQILTFLYNCILKTWTMSYHNKKASNLMKIKKFGVLFLNQKEEDAFSAVIIAINIIIICYTANNIIYYIYDFNSIESHLQEWFCLWWATARTRMLIIRMVYILHIKTSWVKWKGKWQIGKYICNTWEIFNIINYSI